MPLEPKYIPVAMYKMLVIETSRFLYNGFFSIAYITLINSVIVLGLATFIHSYVAIMLSILYYPYVDAAYAIKYNSMKLSKEVSLSCINMFTTQVGLINCFVYSIGVITVTGVIGVASYYHPLPAEVLPAHSELATMINLTVIMVLEQTTLSAVFSVTTFVIQLNAALGCNSPDRLQQKIYRLLSGIGMHINPLFLCSMLVLLTGVFMLAQMFYGNIGVLIIALLMVPVQSMFKNVLCQAIYFEHTRTEFKRASRKVNVTVPILTGN
jgi:hypothetical protein